MIHEDPGESEAERRELPLPGGDFRLFVEKLRIQALLTMGLVENPATGSRHVNLPHARAIVQDLKMLAGKTAGNLTEDERHHLAVVLADVQASYQRLSELEG